MSTLPERLRAAADRSPDAALTFPASAERLTLPELVAAADAFAYGLLTTGVEPGDRVGVLSRNTADFIVGVLGIAAAGAAACPLPLPTSTRDLSGYTARVVAVSAAAGIDTVVVGARTEAMARRIGEHLPATTFLPAAGLAGATGSGLPAVAAADLAIVQFTSGSTSVPKGVRLSHTNVVAGTAAISGGVGMGDGDHGATWLPLYHDMGLFGALSALLAGISMTVWPPATFVKDPAAWLHAFIERRCTIAAAPNFGYEMLVDAVPAADAAALDLSGWRVAFNGAEPVLPAAVERFLHRFAPSGFRQEAMYPVYGMAEATLAVTFPPRDRAPLMTWVDRERLAAGEVHAVPRSDPGARGFVALGRPVAGMALRIVDPAGRPGDLAAAGRVGEIEISGASVTAGYLGLEPHTGWLATGDLGFVEDGDLYVTGRRKEMIIVRGVNFYPEDAEAVVREAPGVHRRRCVAVADTAADGAEAITVIAETALADPAARTALAADLRVALVEALDLDRVLVHLVAPDVLPRTSSGKFRRLDAIRSTQGEFSAQL